MPKLLFLAACQRAIVDQKSQNVSLIDVINGLIFQSTSKALVPEDAQTPLKWFVVAVWVEGEGDAEKTYEQRLQIVSPSGKKLTSSILPFTFNTRAVNTVVEVGGFPAGRSGIVRAVIDVREQTDNSKFRKVAEYPIEVVISE